MENIETNIQKIILEKGLLKKHVAELAGFDQKAFSNMLHGRGTLKAQYVPNIAKALGVTPNELYGINSGQKAG